jgi:threonine synthase
MDILISSNLERLLHLLSEKDSSKVKELMIEMQTKGIYEIDDNMKNALKDFYGNFASEEDTKEAIDQVYNQYSYLIDTHTAVAYSVNKKYKEEFNDSTKAIIASTASPYKFPYSVMNSIDSKYSDFDDFKLVKEMSKLIKEEEPTAIKDIQEREVLHNTVCEKDEMKLKVKEILNL